MIKQIACAICLIAIFSCTSKPKLDVNLTAKDLSPPRVISITPADGETEVADKPVIGIVFNEPMSPGSLNSSTITVRTANGNVGVGNYEYDATSNRLTIQIVQSLYLNAQYTIRISDSVRDLAGNPIAPVTSRFSTDVCPKSRKGKPVLNGQVLTVTKVGCTIYIGGNFTSVGDGASFGVAVDPLYGNRLPTFSAEDINGSVQAVADDGEGGWYIGGDFSRVGSHERNGLARIAGNGEVYPWNPGANGSVRTIVVHDNVVYLGGHFTILGGAVRNRLAAVDRHGNVTPWNPSANNWVNRLVYYDNKIYAAGWFTCIGNCASGVENSDKWTRTYLAAFTLAGDVTPWNPAPDNVVRAMSITPSGTIYVGGLFGCFGNCTAGTEGVDKWTRSRLGAVDSSASILVWNPGADSSVETIVASDTEVYIGGTFTTVNGIGRQRLAAINSAGTVLSWDPRANDSVVAMRRSGNVLWIGGFFTQVGCSSGCTLSSGPFARGGAAALYVDSTLHSWHPNTNSAAFALAVEADRVYVGGNFTTIAPVVRDRMAAISTDGILQSFNPGFSSRVWSMAVSQDSSTLYVGGEFTVAGGTPRNYLAAVSTSGTVLTGWTPSANASVNTLVRVGNMLYIGGVFTSINSTTRNRVAAVDITGTLSTTWNPSVNNGQVNALAVTGDSVYVGGSFTQVGCAAGCSATGGPYTRNRLTAINADGTMGTWNPDANDFIRSIAVADSLVYVGGNFTTVGAVTRNRLAAIGTDGVLAPWNPNANSAVFVLQTLNGLVYASGDFTCFGDCASGIEGQNKWTRNRLTRINANGDILSGSAGFNALVSAMYSSGNTMYAGGLFTQIDSVTRGRFASINTDGSVNW